VPESLFCRKSAGNPLDNLDCPGADRSKCSNSPGPFGSSPQILYHREQGNSRQRAASSAGESRTVRRNQLGASPDFRIRQLGRILGTDRAVSSSTTTNGGLTVGRVIAHYAIRPHSALGYRPPAPEIIEPREELPMTHEAA